MDKYTLLINGKDVDTGNYKYFPYIDKKICDFETTIKMQTNIKAGKISEDDEYVNKYIFAKYCIGKEDTNRKAIEAAYNAFKIFRKFSLSMRKKIFLDMHKILLEKKDEFINLLI